jgi:metal-responsive CopG/Arc/MetJ family transcriptional regulator
MKNITRNTEVISISLPKETADKLEKTRKARGQSRSALITSLIDREAEEGRWQKIYKKGQETAKTFKITSEDDIDRILHAP